MVQAPRAGQTPAGAARAEVPGVTDKGQGISLIRQLCIFLAASLVLAWLLRALLGPVAPFDAALHEYYQNHPEDLQRALAAAAEDPELQPLLAELQSHGVEAVMRHYDNEPLLLRLSEKMGGIPEEVWASAPLPLHDAAKQGLPAAIRASISQAGSEVLDALDDEKGIPALGYAAAYGHVAAVEQLLALRADVRATDKQGNSILHLAAGYGRTEICRLLSETLTIEDAHVRNAAGQTPSDVAHLNGHDSSKLLKGLLPRLSSREAKSRLDHRVDL
eukprot:TRINITY_DN93966_c0_g1_i1.p1 TRINITY_DN93966_c0_g1~~TRINITY_DN93966_c0_g1_i1.p1  ORF type:complete len:287 (+),score=58.57 TRINITY_DN93966_c0_g1_i1:37-861(+)